MNKTGESISIRPGRVEDASSITGLCHQLGYPAERAEISSRLEFILQDPRSTLWVAAQPSSVVVGWIHAFLVQLVESPYRAEIGGMIVDQQLGRQGIGTKLVGAVQEWAKAKNVVELSVRCNVSRPEAHAFYNAMGFKSVKTQLVFRKQL